MASERHTMRQIVVQTLFAWEFRGGDIMALMAYNFVNGAPQVKESTFAYQLLEKVTKNQEKIVEAIEKYAPEWTLDKIAPLDRAILEVGMAELLYDPNVPHLVAINEAIELAKEFGGENSSKFVNGVLSSLYDDIKLNEKTT